MQRINHSQDFANSKHVSRVNVNAFAPKLSGLKVGTFGAKGLDCVGFTAEPCDEGKMTHL